MATQAYDRWVAAGKPWQLAKPIAQLRTWANQNDIPVLGTIGNQAHLTASFPEDHTPFSFTAWPVPLPGYWVCAIDLADVRGLGSLILELARDGELPWLKYMNFAGRSYAFADGFKAAARNPDHHVHLSVFSDDLGTSIGDFDPFKASAGEDDMELRDKIDFVDEKTGKRWSFGQVANSDGGSVEGALGCAYGSHYGIQRQVNPGLKRLEARLDALAKSLEALVPGVAEACSEAAANVTAAEVAGELEVRVRDGG